MTPEEIEERKRQRQILVDDIISGKNVPVVTQPATDAVAPLFPKQVEEITKGTDLYFSAKSGKAKEQVVAELQNDINASPDFTTYAKLSKSLSEIERDFKPGEIISFAGERPVKSDEMRILGIFPTPAPSTIPVNVPASKKMGTAEAISDVLSPQIMVGPVAAEFEKPTSDVRAKTILSDARFAESLKDVPAADIPSIKEDFEGARAMVTTIAEKLGPDASDEDIIAQYKIEIEDLGPRLKGESTRESPSVITQEPGKAPNLAAAIYSRQTKPGSVPNLTDAQIAFLEKRYQASYPRLSKRAEADLKQKLETEDIPEVPADLTETDVAAGAAPRLTTRKRTPVEVQQALAAQLPKAVADLEPPWWMTGKKSEVISNPEKFAEGSGLLEKLYPTGATKEGFGAYALRMAMSPINITATTLGAGSARVGEAAAKLNLSKEEVARTPSVVTRAREARGDKGAALPEGFIGDLADSVMLNRGGTQVVGDIYKELGLNENVGMGLGFALDIIAPPVGGLASSSIKGGKAFNGARAARAAGLIGSEAPIAAGAKAFGDAMRDAWTWRSVVTKAGTVAPSSIKVLAAEDTGRMLALREDIIAEIERIAQIERTPRPLNEAETIAVVDKFSAANEGGGKIAKDFAKAARAGRASELAADVATGVNRITRDSYFGGAASIPKRADRIGQALEFTTVDGAKALNNIGEAELKTIIRNTAGRSEDAAEILRNSTGSSSQILTDMYKADPQAVRRAVGSTVAYDAFNQAQKAKGFAEFPDLVLISNRFIGTPDVALAAGEASLNTELGILISRIAGEGSETRVVAATPEMLAINPTRAVAVVDVNPSQVDFIRKAVNGFEKSGIMSANDAAYARALLNNNQMSVTGLRYLAESNIDSIIAGGGRAVDITNIAPVAGKSGPFGIVTEQVLAKQSIFTPPEMRSAFDGIGYRVQAIRGDAKAAAQFLDVPPDTLRAVNDFYAQAGNIDKKIKSTFDALRGNNPELRTSYGLPPTGKVSDSDVLMAMARGVDASDTDAFINSVTDLVMGGYVDKASNITDQWMTRSFFSTNTDTYLSPVGAGLVDDAKELAVRQIQTNAMPVNDVVKELTKRIYDITAEKANTTAAYRLTNRLVLKTEAELEKAIPKIVGGSIFTRESDILANTVRNKVVADDAVASVEKLLPDPIKNVLGIQSRQEIATAIANLTGRTEDEILRLIDKDYGGQKILIAGAIQAGKNGYVGSEGLLRGMIEVVANNSTRTRAIDRVIAEISATNPGLINALDLHAPTYYTAADQALLRARLNGDSIDDVVSVIFGQTRGTASLPRSIVTGQLVDDAINKFFQEETFGPVMQKIYSELPNNQGAAQKAIAGVWNALQYAGNIRYNAFLYLRPNYHTMNIVTAPLILHSTLGIENAPLLPDFYHATRAMQSGVGKAVGAADNTIAFIDKAGRPFTYGEIRDLGVRSGLFKTEQQVLFSQGSLEAVIEDAESLFKLEPGKFVGTTSPREVLRSLKDPHNWPADWANSTDNFWRMSSFIKGLREGKPVTIAQEIGKKSLFDFGSLGPKERAFASRFLIFYTFSRVSAEQLVKSLGNPAAFSRFVRQAAVTRDVGKLVYDHAGGEEYDVRRLYLKDKDLSRIFWPSEKVGLYEYTSFTPGAPSIDSFMTIAGLLYARTPLEVVAGQQTGLGQFADPLLKEFILAAPERGDQERRADKLRLVDARRIAALNTVGGLGVFTSVFGPITAINPTKETTTTYNDQEWQLSPDGYRLYKEFNRWSQVAGLASTGDYYSQLAGGLQMPGRGIAARALGFGAQERPTATVQEQAVLKMQEKAISERAKLREEQQGIQIKKSMGGAQ